MTAPAEIPTPPNVAPYVRALGLQIAVDFIMEFGGAAFYVAQSPEGRSRAAASFGIDAAKRVAAELAKDYGHTTNVRVPMPKPWLARMLKARGLPIQEIARKLKISDKTARVYVPLEERGREPRQLTLF